MSATQSTDTKSPPKHGTFCWNELMTADAGKALDFYKSLLGWSTEAMDMGPAGTYTTIRPKGSENSIGGVMEMKGPQYQGVPPHWLAYIAVDDIEQSTKQVASLGGKVHVPVTPIPGIGRFSIIEDPTGAKVALYQGDAS